MITFRNVHFSYQERPILKDLSLHLPQGSFQFLIGPSGAGKSTFLKLCSCDLLPNSGQVELFEAPTHRLSRDHISEIRRKIGFVHQEAYFVDHLNVMDNVLLPVVASGLDANAERKNVEELLQWVGLGEQMTSFPQELSGGEKQRVALARAIIMAPDIILADEPTGNIDWEMGARLIGLLAQLNSMGKTVLIATHDLNLIRASKNKIKSRTLRLDRGQIEIAGSDL